jgi:SAM-dependent methyltransferase
LDKWRYYDIRFTRHLLCNPINPARFEGFCQRLNLARGTHVLDIGCGKGEFLVRLAELYGVSGVGVDQSPYCTRASRANAARRTPRAALEFVEMDGATYRPKASEAFGVAMCIGASWIFGGHRGTLRTLATMTRPGGYVVVGEAFWRRRPCDAYLRADGITADQFGTHRENVRVGEEEGLACIYTLVSNQDDWDHYKTLGWWSLDEYVRTHPDDPDVSEIAECNGREKTSYLRWQRDTLGWALYLFRNPWSRRSAPAGRTT